jgi:hypothetical protein
MSIKWRVLLCLSELTVTVETVSTAMRKRKTKKTWTRGEIADCMPYTLQLTVRRKGERKFVIKESCLPVILVIAVVVNLTVNL